METALLDRFHRLKWYQQQKLEKAREIRRLSYHRRKNEKSEINIQSETRDAKWKRNQRKKKQVETEKRNTHLAKIRERVKRYREKKKTERLLDANNSAMNNNDDDIRQSVNFKHRMEKKRAIGRLRNSLPKTPDRRVQVVEAYLNHNSPTSIKVKKSISPSDEVNSSIVQSLKSAISETKSKRSDDARKAMNVLVAAVSGNRIVSGKSKGKVARSLGLPSRRISSGVKIRTKVLSSEKSCWTYTARKTRSDATSESDKKTAYEFWLRPGNSRPTGNKSDIKRMRIGPKTYSSHMVHILEKSQTDVYFDFVKNFPHLKMCQRTFERCKPFFVQPVRPKDRQTCVCRYHIEAKALFKSCMNFRQKMTQENQALQEEYPVYEHLNDIIQVTLCPNEPQSMNCLNRKCSDCGMSKLTYLPDELETSEEAIKVSWSRYEYININMKKGKTVRKLSLVKKETSPGEMFAYFQDILSTFPAHQFRAQHQSAQLKSIQENLPLNACLCVHDFSENFTCFDKQEIQSAYFQKNEVSIHVSVIYRHAVLEYDGMDSTMENPNIVTEHFFLISPDLSHDHNFSQHAQKLITEYLDDIGCKVSEMHEFTDGCQCQYKSRHCIGGISIAPVALRMRKVVRNFFESAHGKGPQDAAGGTIKQQADMAIRRGTATIQSTKDFYDFAVNSLQNPKFSVCKRRIFRYVENIPRNVDLRFKPIQRNRTIHQVSTTATPGKVVLRELSCYCDSCLHSDSEECENVHNGEVRKVTMEQENSRPSQPSRDDPEDTPVLRDLAAPGCVAALFTDDPLDDYYLLKITSEPTKTCVTDKWGNIYQPGSDVIQGLYYNKTGQFTYRLIKGRHAYVPTASLRYLLVNEARKDTVVLNEHDHLDILSAIDEFEFH